MTTAETMSIKRYKLYAELGDYAVPHMMLVAKGDYVLYDDHLAELASKDARIAELEARLEIDPRHPYDGIACRDETIKLQYERIKELEAERDAWQRKYIEESKHSRYVAVEVAKARNEALEEAAKICDAQAERARTSPGNARASFCADRIRDMKSAPPPLPSTTEVKP